MRIATLDDLIAADDMERWESPLGFDYLAAIKDITDLVGPLSEAFGMEFVLDRHVEDASFYCDLSVTGPPRGKQIDTIVAIRFSSFGRFFSIWGTSSQSPLTDDLRMRVAEFVCEHGYLYVPAELARQPSPDLNRFPDWESRYFDYT